MESTILEIKPTSVYNPSKEITYKMVDEEASIEVIDAQNLFYNPKMSSQISARSRTSQNFGDESQRESNFRAELQKLKNKKK
jgi:hypothetical protein